MTYRTRLVVLLISTPVLAFAVIGGFLGRASAQQENAQHLRVFEDVIALVVNNYVESPDLDKVMQGAMHGLADGLDPDTAYLRPDEVRRFEAAGSLEPADVGVELTRQYYLRIIATRDNSPAHKAGLRTGDYVRAIDGTATRDMSVFTGMRLLRGAPGSKVTLTVLRGNTADPHDVQLVRATPAEPILVSRMQIAGIGYVRIPAFSSRTADQLRAAITALQNQGAGHVLIDIRGTATGPLESGLAAARLFVASGTLAAREIRGQGRESITAVSGDGSLTIPVTLLVNAGTSSAAELFASALTGNKRAELVGEHTLGRAGMQKLVKLPDGSGVYVTSGRYLTPAGTPLHGKGLEPQVPVEEPDVDFGAALPTTDPVLEKAIERASVKRAA